MLWLSGCALTGSPHLQEYRPGSGGSVTVATEPDGRYAFDDLAVCVEGEGEVEITKVEPIEPSGGFTVDAFSVLPAASGEVSAYVSDYRAPLAAVGYPASGTMIVRTSCPADDEVGSHLNYTRIGIEVSGGDDAVAATRGIRVTYDSSGGQRATDYPFGIGLCDADSAGTDNPECTVSHIRVDGAGHSGGASRPEARAERMPQGTR